MYKMIHEIHNKHTMKKEAAQSMEKRLKISILHSKIYRNVEIYKSREIIHKYDLSVLFC